MSADEPDQTNPKYRTSESDDRDEDAEDRAADDTDADDARSEVADISQQVGLDDERVSESAAEGESDSGSETSSPEDGAATSSSTTEGGETGGATAGGAGTPAGSTGTAGGSGGAEATASTDSGGFTFSPSEVNDWGELGSYGFPEGVSSANMRVAEVGEWDGESNDGLAFVTFYTNSDDIDPSIAEESSGSGVSIYGEDSELGHRQMVAHSFLDAAGGNVPAHVGHPDDDGYVAVEGVEGENIGSASRESLSKVDEDEFVDEAALQVLAGNNDSHMQNMLVTDDGTVVTHDLDHSAGDITSDFTGQKGWYSNALDRTLGEVWRSGKHVYSGSEAEFKADVTNRATELAQELQDDPAVTEALSDAEQYDPALADNIRSNISEAADGNIRPE